MSAHTRARSRPYDPRIARLLASARTEPATNTQSHPSILCAPPVARASNHLTRALSATWGATVLLLVIGSLYCLYSLAPRAEAWALQKASGLSAEMRLTEGASVGDADQVETAVQAGADINSRAIGDISPLMVAAQTSSASVLETMLRLGANPNGRDRHGTTPLMYAVRSNNVSAVIALLRGGARVDLTNDLGLSAFSLAMQSGHDDIRAVFADYQQRSAMLAAQAATP